MCSIRILLRQLHIQFNAWLSKPHVWAGLLLGVSLAFYPTFSLIELANNRGAYINVLEAFVIIGSSRNYCMFTLLGVLVMLSDAPFIDDMNIYVSLRVTRRTWFVSKFVSVLMNCMLFYLAVLIATVLLCAPVGYVDNDWSKTMLELLKNENLKFEYGLAIDNELLLVRFTPISAALFTFALQSMYTAILAELMFLLNMKRNKAVGVFAALMIHAVGSWIISETIMFNQMLTLLGHSMLGYHNLALRGFPDVLAWLSFLCSRYATLEESIVLFVVILLIELLTGLKRVRSMRFKVPNRDI